MYHFKGHSIILSISKNKKQNMYVIFFKAIIVSDDKTVSFLSSMLVFELWLHNRWTDHLLLLGHLLSFPFFPHIHQPLTPTNNAHRKMKYYKHNHPTVINIQNQCTCTQKYEILLKQTLDMKI